MNDSDFWIIKKDWSEVDNLGFDDKGGYKGGLNIFGGARWRAIKENGRNNSWNTRNDINVKPEDQIYDESDFSQYIYE